MAELANNTSDTLTSAPVPTLTFAVEYYQDLMKFEYLNKTLAPLHEMKIAPGSVLKPYQFSCALFTAPTPPIPRIFLVKKEGFEELGLSCFFEGGVLTIEGYDQNGGKPVKSYDGELRIFIDVKIPFRMPTRSFFSIPLSPSCKSALSCIVSDKRVELVPKEFVINPDPETLWKSIPTDPSAPFPKPDSDVFSAEIGSEPALVAIAASQRGRTHANEGNFRDDHFLVDLGADDNDWRIIALADGAGSGRFSRQGAKIVCETVASSLRGYFAEYNVHFDEAVKRVLDAKKDWKTNPTCAPSALQETNLAQFFCLSIRHAWDAIKKTAETRQAKINDFNTTLLCMAVKRYAASETRPALWAIASYWVGDGAAAIFRPNGTARALVPGLPDSGEFAGQTCFVTSPEELAPGRVVTRMRLNVVEEFQALALMTDGVSDPFFPAEVNVTEYKYWKTFWNETLAEHFPGVLDPDKTPQERADALLDGLDFFVKGNHDDRTLALLINDRCKLIDEPEEESELVKSDPIKSDPVINVPVRDELSDEFDLDYESGSSLIKSDSSSDPDGISSDSSLLADDDSSLLAD